MTLSNGKHTNLSLTDECYHVPLHDSKKKQLFNSHKINFSIHFADFGPEFLGEIAAEFAVLTGFGFAAENPFVFADDVKYF